MRILLVEDDEANLDLFTDVLDAAGHSVVVERDGINGRTRALQEPFDLIILDIQLPRLEGDVLCRELREHGMRIPIIAISANALPLQVEAGLAAGFDRYLTKPIGPAALRAAVADYASTDETA